MGLFSEHQSRQWHRAVDTAAGSERPIAAGSVHNQNFPWVRLRLHTDRYLEKKGRLTQEERDSYLTSLIRKHGAKDIAIAACAHAMSPRVVKDLLRLDFEVSPASGDGISSYLQAIVAANRVNPDSVSEPEAKRAQALISFSAYDPAAAGRCLEVTISLLVAGVPTHSLLRPHIHVLARRACGDLEAQLEALREKSRWSASQVAVTWLATLSARFLDSPSENREPEQLLDSAFPRWRAWASWKPNADRLRLWEGYGDEQRENLRDLLALEGPDFVSKGQATLREGLIAQDCSSTIRRGDLHIKLKNGAADEAHNMLNRMSNTLDAACQAGTDDVALLIHLCVGKPVDDEALQILEDVSRAADPFVSAMVLQIHIGRNGSTSLDAGDAVQLLPALNDARAHALRKILAPHLIDCISRRIWTLQNGLCTQTQADHPWDGAEMLLQAIGKVVLDTPWLQPLVDAPLRSLLANWPTAEEVKIWRSIHLAARRATPRTSISLIENINMYCTDRLVMRGAADASARCLVETLIRLWQQTADTSRQVIALLVAQGQGINLSAQCRCIAELPTWSDDFVNSLQHIMQGYGIDADDSCVDLARLLASTHLPNVVACLSPILYHMIEEREATLLRYTLSHLTAKQWLQWMGDLKLIYGDVKIRDPHTSLSILQPSLHAWSQRLAVYLPTLTRVEKSVGCSPAMQCLLMGDGGHLTEILLQILDLLARHEEKHYEPAMQAVIALLTRDGGNAEMIHEALVLLTATTSNGLSACMRLLELEKQISPEVAEVVLAVWLQAPDLEAADCLALEAVAAVIGVHFDGSVGLSAGDLEAISDYLDDQVAQLLADAERLEDLRLTVKAHDPKGTSALLASLQIEEPLAVDDALANLPTALVDVIEKIDDHQLELHFPLIHLKPFQRIAMGAGNAQNVFIRLVLGHPAMPPGFCVHFGNEVEPLADEHGHCPWLLFDDKAPDVAFCHGRASRTTYQLARILSRHLGRGFDTLEGLYALVVATLDDGAQSCIVCGMPHGTRLHRSTVCGNTACAEIFTRASFDVRLADIRQDPAVVDLLLVAVAAMASSRNLNLMSGCPIGDPEVLLALLDTLPPVALLKDVQFLESTIRSLGSDATTLLSWVCNSFRGFIASASGQLRIPGMPGVHQFILASAAPELERAFAGDRVSQSNPPTRVLFHGTSPDRLHAIISQGLRVCSGTPLQRNGAASGHGIYMAEEPATACNYARQGTGWANSAFPQVRVLLGCEVVNTPSNMSTSHGVCVITDPRLVMVRYIFLLEPAATAPLAAHITPAMASAFASLRSGPV